MELNRRLNILKAVLALLIVTGCAKNPIGQELEVALRASLPGSEIWDENDLLYLNGAPGSLSVTEQEGKVGLFTFPCRQEQSEYHVFYAPDGSSADFGRIYFPPTRNSSSCDIGWKQSPMYGYAESADMTINLLPLTANLRIELEDIEYISSISLSSRSGESLSGIFRMNRSTAGLSPVSGSSTSLAISYKDGLTAENNRIYLSIPIPAQRYAKGFELKAHQKGGKIQTCILKGNGLDADAGSVIPVIPDSHKDPDTPVTPASENITVACYNVLVNDGRIEAMSLPNSMRSLGENMLQTEADILALNEIDETLATSQTYNLARIGKDVGMDSYSWKIKNPSRVMNDGSLSYYYSNGFAFNTATVECLESEMMWFTTLPTVTAVKSEAKSSHVAKYCTMIWSRFRHKATQKEFYTITTHLPLASDGTTSGYKTGQHATLCAEALNAFIKAKAPNAPWILLGDFNACDVYSSTDETNYKAYNTLIREWRDVYNILSDQNELDELYRRYNGTLSGSSSKYYYDVYAFTQNQPTRRIDHIMVRNCIPLSYRTIMSGYMYNGRKYCPSDHIPVVATISLK